MRRLAGFLLFAAVTSAEPRPVRLLLLPPNPLLFGTGASQQVAAIIRNSDGSEQDVTDQASFVSRRASVATVDTSGVVRATGNGAASIEAEYSGLRAATLALVQHATQPIPLTFAGDVMPILTKAGCNNASCHGMLTGQNGFKLSLYGSNPEADHDMLVSHDGGRRINRTNPARSLLLLKPTFEVKHGGGERFKAGSPEYKVLLEWIASGARRDPHIERRMISLQVFPSDTVLFGEGTRRRLLVRGRYSDGTEGDVTDRVNFFSNDSSIASVSAEGWVTAVRGGETAIVPPVNPEVAEIMKVAPHQQIA